MRILYVITSLLTGGAEKLVVDLIPKLIEKGHQVDLAVFNAKETPLMKQLEKCQVCKIHKLGNSFYDIRHIFKLRHIMKDYDIIHTHNSSPQLFAAIANLGLHKKLVTTEHNTFNRKRNNVFMRTVDHWMYKKYDRIVCISDRAAENLMVYLGTNSRIQTIYNGIDVEQYFKAPPINGMHGERFVILMVAAFRSQKDQDTLVRAMKLLPKNQYVLWLAGYGERIKKVKDLVKELQLEEQVSFLGNRNDVPRLLHTADVVVMSTHYEGLSLSNIEGMSVGKPFVASDVDGIHEVTDGYGLLFPHEDAQALADVIIKLRDDSLFYKEVAERCYTRAQDFDLQRTVDAYDKVYSSVFG